MSRPGIAAAIGVLVAAVSVAVSGADDLAIPTPPASPPIQFDFTVSDPMRDLFRSTETGFSVNPWQLGDAITPVAPVARSTTTVLGLSELMAQREALDALGLGATTGSLDSLCSVLSTDYAQTCVRLREGVVAPSALGGGLAYGSWKLHRGLGSINSNVLSDLDLVRKFGPVLGNDLGPRQIEKLVPMTRRLSGIAAIRHAPKIGIVIGAGIIAYEYFMDDEASAEEAPAAVPGVSPPVLGLVPSSTLPPLTLQPFDRPLGAADMILQRPSPPPAQD